METADQPLVLVVDDEPGIRLVLTGLLGQMGYRAIEASNAREALELVEHQAVEVVLTDLQMPGEDGLWLLNEVRAQSPFVPVILLTAHGTVDNAVTAMRRGAFDFLTKPVQRDELEATLSKAVPVSDRLFAGASQLDLVAESEQMRSILQLCRRMANSQAPVLITGPSGTGKEVVAKTLHALRNPDAPFVVVNCAAIPETLLESELFGHTKGSFTGATCDKPGRVELAATGTLFLDEIGDISPAIQVKLLRLVQEKTFERVGGLGTRKADLRIIAATHRDLALMVSEGTFREDLFFRLNVLPIVIPPLVERPDDVSPLAHAFLSRAAGAEKPPTLGSEALEYLRSLPWPGNARELGNLMERVYVLCTSTSITVADIEECRQLGLPSAPTQNAAVPKQDERERITEALQRAGGKRTLAAKLLGVSRRTLYNKLEKYDLA